MNIFHGVRSTTVSDMEEDVVLPTVMKKDVVESLRKANELTNMYAEYTYLNKEKKYAKYGNDFLHPLKDVFDGSER